MQQTVFISSLCQRTSARRVGRGLGSVLRDFWGWVARGPCVSCVPCPPRPHRCEVRPGEMQWRQSSGDFSLPAGPGCPLREQPGSRALSIPPGLSLFLSALSLETSGLSAWPSPGQGRGDSRPVRSLPELPRLTAWPRVVTVPTSPPPAPPSGAPCTSLYCTWSPAAAAAAVRESPAPESRKQTEHVQQLQRVWSPLLLPLLCS